MSGCWIGRIATSLEALRNLPPCCMKGCHRRVTGTAQALGCCELSKSRGRPLSLIVIIRASV